MKRCFILGLCALSIIALSACSTQRFDINPNPIASNQPSYEGTSHFMFWGWRQTQTMRPGRACGVEGVNRVETRQSAVNALLTIITLGIYSPRDYAVYCNNQF